MKDPAPRIGILADQPLQQQRLRSLLTEAGLHVVLCTAPQRTSPALLDSSSVALWLVDTDLEACPDDVLDAVFGEHQAPVIINEGMAQRQDEQAYQAWSRRLLDKIHSALPPAVSSPVTALIDDRELFSLPTPVKTVLPLPSSLTPTNEHDPVRTLWVIGASLGGPAAVKTFLDLLPAQLPCAFLYAQHIDAQFQDSLLNAVGRHSSLTLTHLREGITLRNGHVYLVPVEQTFSLDATNLVQLHDTRWSGPYAPSIDETMEFAAVQFSGQCHALIFSGMDGDALVGAEQIRAAGGQVWTQAPRSCIQSAMPDAIHQAGLSNYRDTPQALAHAIVNHLVTEQQRMSSSPLRTT
ncbi:hypothetical protein NFC81_00265 [Salinispirillum sp. LH 10-3-1]|uniref:protein-glutamate methylesterase n=1 Tax=Salinispirillum sp. LH 10-3-1 TaxID=2952525 RepID=A0AB38YGA7_9GAMM